MTETIIEETQRESIINRPHNLAGSIKPIDRERFNISTEAITYGVSSVVPALLKVFMEALDNPIDVAIKGGCNKIDIKVDETTIDIKDNGYGVDTSKVDDEYVIYKAFCKYNTSSNYGDKRGQGQKGVNGIGVKLCTTLSTYFEVTSEDSKAKIKLTASHNNHSHIIKELKKSGNTGVQIKFKPDFNIFSGDKIDDAHILRMYEYVLLQALTYPYINFSFNGKRISYTPKKFISLLNENHIVETYEDFFIAIVPNETDDFKQISYVNGLETFKGGTHVDYVTDKLVTKIKDRIVKRYKSIKHGDIKNKITVVIIAKNVKEIDWDGQTKESITTPPKYFGQYFKEIDFDKLALKVYKNKAITDPIVDYFKIKEEFKKSQELKTMDKTVKKIKSEKYTKPVGKPEVLFICEGKSASSALLPGIGRKGFGYYELKGKPLNAYTASQSKFTQNKELKELYQIIKQEGYTKFAIAADADLDGIAIVGLLIAFAKTYLLEELSEDMFYMLKTPVGIASKNKKIVNWVYNIEEMKDLEGPGLSVLYLKGLGTWKSDNMKVVLEKEGIDKMLVPLSYTEDDDIAIDDWYGDKKADVRKEKIMLNEFELVKL